MCLCIVCGASYKCVFCVKTFFWSNKLSLPINQPSGDAALPVDGKSALWMKKSPNHENAYANITCNFRDDDISRLGVAYQTHTIRDTYIATSIIVRYCSDSI